MWLKGYHARHARSMLSRLVVHHARSISTTGFAFDVDGVLMRGSEPLPGASAALQRLRVDDVPFVVLTNNGGLLESERAGQLTKALGVDILPEQVQSFAHHITVTTGPAFCGR